MGVKEELRLPRCWRVSKQFRDQFDTLVDWEAIFADPRPYIVVEKLHRLVLFVPTPGRESSGLYVKIFRVNRSRDKLRNLYRPSFGAREYFMTKLLSYFGFNTLTAVGYGTLSMNPLKNSLSVFVSESLDNALPLTTYICADVTHPQELQMSLARRFGRFLARLHRYGIYVRDLHLDNVLVKPEGDDLQLYLIDHESTRPVSGWFSRHRLRNLSSALFAKGAPLLSEELRDVFLHSYLEALRGTTIQSAQVRELVGEIDETHRKLTEKRERRTEQRPFRTERIGDLKIQFRRGLNGSEVAQRYQSVKEAPDGHSVLLSGLRCILKTFEIGEPDEDLHSHPELVASVQDSAHRRKAYFLAVS